MQVLNKRTLRVDQALFPTHEKLFVRCAGSDQFINSQQKDKTMNDQVGEGSGEINPNEIQASDAPVAATPVEQAEAPAPVDTPDNGNAVDGAGGEVPDSDEAVDTPVDPSEPGAVADGAEVPSGSDGVDEDITETGLAAIAGGVVGDVEGAEPQKSIDERLAYLEDLGTEFNTVLSGIIERERDLQSLVHKALNQNNVLKNEVARLQKAAGIKPQGEALHGKIDDLSE